MKRTAAIAASAVIATASAQTPTQRALVACWLYETAQVQQLAAPRPTARWTGTEWRVGMLQIAPSRFAELESSLPSWVTHRHMDEPYWAVVAFARYTETVLVPPGALEPEPITTESAVKAWAAGPGWRTDPAAAAYWQAVQPYLIP